MKPNKNIVIGTMQCVVFTVEMTGLEVKAVLNLPLVGSDKISIKYEKTKICWPPFVLYLKILTVADSMPWDPTVGYHTFKNNF